MRELARRVSTYTQCSTHAVLRSAQLVDALGAGLVTVVCTHSLADVAGQFAASLTWQVSSWLLVVQGCSGPEKMEPAYRATSDLLVVTRRIGALQLERSVLLASVHDDVTRVHVAEVERELNALENALDSVAMLLSDESDGAKAAATPQLAPDVSRELETHMVRVEQLAVERDVLEAEIAAASLGEARTRSQLLLQGVESELSELECTLDELSRQFGGADGPLSWAISPRASGQGDSDVEPASSVVSPSAEGHPSGESRVPNPSIFSDSDSDDWIATRAISTPCSLPVATPRDPEPSRRTAGFRRGSCQNQVHAQNNDVSRRAEARAHTRALLDGGLGHAMRGLRPSG